MKCWGIVVKLPPEKRKKSWSWTIEVSGRRVVMKTVRDGEHSANCTYMWSKTMDSFASASIAGVCM